MQVTIDFPDSYVQLHSVNQIQQQVRLHHALLSYQQGDLSLSKSAELAGVDIYAFLYACSRYKISVINVTSDELDKELEALRAVTPCS